MKFILGFVILGLAIITVSCITGYNEFKADIEKQYNDQAYQIAHSAAGLIDEATAKEYGKIAKDYSNGNFDQKQIDEIIASDKYQKIRAQFLNLRENMGANDIYLVYCNLDVLNDYKGTKDGWNPFTYVFDCYAEEEYSYVLGNQSPINPDFIEPTTQIVKTGKRVNNYFESQSDYGYNTTALITVPMGDDENLALGVEIPMTTIQSSLSAYLKKTLAFTFLIVVLGIAIFVAYLLKKVISPINTVAHETANFVENENQMSDKLENIKTGDEIENLSKSVLKMEHDLNDYIDNLTKVTAEKERIGAELDVATNIQASMLPCIFPAFPEIEEVDVYATMNPAKEVGGDFYDFFMVDDTHVAIVAADVSGKGVPAALFMVIGKTLIKDHTTPGVDLGDVFTEVNDLLCQSNSEGLFITAFEGVLDLVTGEFRYVNAGHETPFISKAGEKFNPYPIKAGFVLAGMEGIKYKSNSIMLEPGDRVFEYTDGVTEATNKDNHLFGMERLENSLEKHASKSIHELLPAVKSDIDEFVAEAPQFDDITMICLEYKSRMQEF
ncbi:MAG: PP2C family protein-serine/threonine phosphatase [Clostridiales bacterium]|nr:PP2C family protein-serine/threonine phosphatase [Candidatus Crickella equi]